jgi:hypothetical protein
MQITTTLRLYLTSVKIPLFKNIIINVGEDAEERELSHTVFFYFFYSCAYNVWVISPHFPPPPPLPPLPPSPPHPLPHTLLMGM